MMEPPLWECMETGKGRGKMWLWLEYELGRLLDAGMAEMQSEETAANFTAHVAELVAAERAEQAARAATLDPLLAKIAAGTATLEERREAALLIDPPLPKRKRGRPKKADVKRLNDNPDKVMAEILVPKIQALWRKHYGRSGKGYMKYAVDFAVRFYWGDEDNVSGGQGFEDVAGAIDARAKKRGWRGKRAIIK